MTIDGDTRQAVEENGVGYRLWQDGHKHPVGYQAIGYQIENVTLPAASTATLVDAAFVSGLSIVTTPTALVVGFSVQPATHWLPSPKAVPPPLR